MVTSLLLALIGGARIIHLTPVSGNMEWEELSYVQKIDGYHPMLRFAPESSFFVKTHDYVAEGKYQVSDGHYFFHPLTAIQLGNREVNELVDDLPPNTRAKLHKKYADSMADFEADYSDRTGVLALTYKYEGTMTTYELYPYTAGDDKLSSAGTDNDRSMVGLWSMPEPFSKKLDARTRYKIGGREGLERFSVEAEASDNSQFGLIDLRVDHSFRSHATIGTWQRVGSTVRLRDGINEMELTIDRNGDLRSGGQVIYTRR